MYQGDTKEDNLYKRIIAINKMVDEFEDTTEFTELKEYVKENPDSTFTSDLRLSKSYNKISYYNSSIPVEDILNDEYAFSIFFKECNIESFILQLIRKPFMMKEILSSEALVKPTTGTVVSDIDEAIQQISKYQYGDRLTIHNKIYNKYSVFKTNGEVRKDFHVNMEDFKELLKK